MKRVALALAGAVAMVVSVAGFALPERPRFHVNDYAGVLSSSAQQGLEQRFWDFERKTGHQAAVAIIPTIEDQPIEDVAVKLYEKWKLGSKKENDGVLLVLAMKEHGVRIEVGYGLEDRLPDAVANHIIRQDMVPFLKQGQVATAVLSFEKRLEEIFVEGKKLPAENGGQGLPIADVFPLVLLIIIVLFVLSSQRRRTLGSGGIARGSNWWWWGGGGWGGGGWGGGGGGGWGGGGWGGGGGGSSGGGGASGNW